MEAAVGAETPAGLSAPPRSRRALGVLENGTVGALAGIIEVLVDQPLVAVKNALQERRAVSLNPAVLYRGVVINAASIAPITAVQFAVNGFGTGVLSRKGTRTLTDVERIGVSALAGAMSAFVSGPAELVMIQQQRTGLGLGVTARTVVSQFGAKILYRGFMATIVRESLFACGYLGIGPVFKDLLVKQFPSAFKGREMSATLLSSIVAGQVAAVLSQPSDTVKTRMQADLGGFGSSTPKPFLYNGPIAAIRALWAEGGIRPFYAGLVPRGLRMTMAVFILTVAGQRLEALFL